LNQHTLDITKRSIVSTAELQAGELARWQSDVIGREIAKAAVVVESMSFVAHAPRKSKRGAE
jgi:hypothetical protein